MRRNTDTSESKAELALKEPAELQDLIQSRKQLETVLNNTVSSIMLLRPVRNGNIIVDFEYIFTNAQTLRSVNKESLTGKHFTREFPLVKNSPLLDAYIRVVETGISYQEEVNIAPYGIPVWAQVFAVKTGDNLLVTYFDITERKNSAEEIIRLKDEIAQLATDKYHTIFTSIDEGFCIIELVSDKDGKAIDYRFVEVNPAFERQTGLQNVGGKLGSELTPGGKPYWIEDCDIVSRSGRPVRSENYHSETDRWYLAYASRIGKADTRQIAIVFTDVTDRKRREEWQSFVLKLNDAFRPLTDPLIIQEVASNLLGQHLKVSRAYYSETIEEQVHINRSYEDGLPPITGKFHQKTIGERLLRNYQAGKVQVCNNTETDPNIPEAERIALKSAGIGAYVAVPLVKSDQWIATLVVDSIDPRKWTPRAIELIQETAERTWLAVERAKAQQAVQLSEERMRAAKEAYQSVVHGARYEDSLHRLAQLATKETSARTAFYIANDQGNMLHPIYDSGNMPLEYLLEVDNSPIGIDSLPSGLAVPKGQPIITPDVFEEPLWRSWTSIARKYDYRGCWSFPIRTRENKPIGIFAMYFRTRRDATENDLALAEIITTTAAVIITNHTDNVKRTKAENALRKNDEQLRELNGKLQEMDKAKTNFFNNVSHEFRTPLTLLLGPLEDLVKANSGGLPSEESQKLNFAYRGAVRLQKLVNTLLDFSRIEAGKMEAFYQPTDFAKATIDLTSNFRSAIEKAGLKFVVKAEEISEPVYLNHEMWEKIVFNLLSNAFKFTHQGKIEVNIREKKKNVELRVKDSGIGIAARNLETIFDRFTRIEGTKARTYEGTGIGLALVRELVTSHGGAIKVKSTEGIGSEFIVSIPKGKSHLPKQQIYESKGRLPGSELKEPFVEEVTSWLPEDAKSQKKKIRKYQREGHRRVLIAEDNADMREYLTSILSEDDYQILALEDGQKVLDFLEEGRETDLILADVMMPVMDGFQLVKKLKSDQRFSDIPIILLSAKAGEDDKIEGLSLGADDYLVKPFSSKQLRAIVSSRIDRARKSTPRGNTVE
jgi:signal transduction histidine kinase/PAS domain-containing protein/ActR/RegA family two-component response regulator